MNQPTNSTPSPGLALGDILFILFRHKGKILVISTLGILGAAALYLFGPVPYQSEAKLFIKYVVDTKAPAQGTANDPRVRMPDERTGGNVINTEVEILTSLDLAAQAAAALPPDVLVKLAGGTNLAKAAEVIKKSLLPDVGKQSDVIHAIFKHKDPDVVQPVLRAMIEAYLIRHAEIHRAVGLYDDYLTKQRDQLKSRLDNTEEDLRKAKAKVGIISIEDSKKSYSEQLVKLRQEIMDTDAQLAERQAEVGAMTRLFPANPSPAASSLVASNVSAGAKVASGPNALTGTNLAAAAYPAPVPSETADEYRRVCGLLESLSKREQELSLQFTPESSPVKGVRAQIAASEKAKRKLEDENPGLLAVKTLDPRFLVPGSDHTPEPTPASSAQISLIAEMARVPGLESRLRVLTNQLAIIRKEAAVVADAEGSITELERQRQLEETNYNYFQKNLEESRADEQLGASRNSNIIPIQTPSPPLRAASKLLKAVAMVLFGSIAGALALAFALEFYLDPSIKRPIEVESRLHLPLFLSIPRLHLNGKASRRVLEAARTPLLPEKTADSTAPEPDASTLPPATRTSLSILPWDSRHSLRPFQDALRDRLIAYFDLKNLTRKPKLVALTSCGQGAGVTTIAAGLAASLSETGDGKVLFVDMNEQGSAHQFYRGNPACGLEDALELERRDTALVQEKLYVVRENQNSDKLPRSVPQHFQHLVPKLKASDYDYVIFDMPPISQISVTSKLARFMDISLVVVEAEETDREAVKRAGSFLAQSGANVGVVLNKTRAHGPKRLQQDL
ncbi:MAG: hypothetical protein ABSH34_01355 [Verrucomicrobiota bacterium]|jgi:uncharacterized protein involved in exopolysaccharide biosynthesis/Mrp family chromosome partitioning ATPase